MLIDHPLSNTHNFELFYLKYYIRADKRAKEVIRKNADGYTLGKSSATVGGVFVIIPSPAALPEGNLLS